MGATQPSCTWGPTQVTNYRAGIQVGCLPFTWALCLPRHVSRPRLFKNRTGSPVQNKSWREGCSPGVQVGRLDLSCGEGLRDEKRSTCSRHRETSQTGDGWKPLSSCLLRFHITSRFQDEQDGHSGYQAHGQYPLKQIFLFFCNQ